MNYATLEEMQDMEFGATGVTKTIDGVQFEMLVSRDGEKFGWAARNNDVDGNMVDWDRVDPYDAKIIGLPL